VLRTILNTAAELADSQTFSVSYVIVGLFCAYACLCHFCSMYFV